MRFGLKELQVFNSQELACRVENKNQWLLYGLLQCITAWLESLDPEDDVIIWIREKVETDDS